MDRHGRDWTVTGSDWTVTRRDWTVTGRDWTVTRRAPEGGRWPARDLGTHFTRLARVLPPQRAVITGVMLDVDGTLVDSNALHAETWVDVFRASGRDVPFEKVLRLIGMGGDKLLPAAIGVEKDSPEGKQLSERRKELFERRLARLQPTPGAPDLVKFLEQEGYRLAVASSAEPEELEALLRVVGAEHLAEKAATSKEAGGSKPEPDIVQVALNKLGCSPDQSVLLGDTPYDIEAAQRAGVAVIGFECGGWRAEDLEGARAVYRDPADLLAHWRDSLLGDR